MWQTFCRYISYPAWDLKDGLGRLSERRSLLRTQRWSAQRLRALQLQRLKHMVEYAYEHCSFYRTHWTTPPDIQSIEDLEKLPLLYKSDVASHAGDIISSAFPKTTLVAAKTGGSTGTSLHVYFDELCQKKRNAAAMRSDGWAGWRPGVPIAGLWGSPPIPRTLKERARNLLHDRLFYLDTMRMDPTSMSEFAREMRKRGPTMLFGHAHSLFIFAEYLHQSGLPVPKVNGIVSTSMVLLERERRTVESVFGIAVNNRYGCEEVGLIASECEHHDGMHINMEHVVVEFIDADGQPVSPGQEGRIVVTDLNNHGMPLIRYVVGDMAVPVARTCRCGRGLEIFDRLTGRTADYLKRRDGSQVSGISLVEKTLTAISGIAQLQIIQESLDAFVLNVVRNAEFDDLAYKKLANSISEIFGDHVTVDIHLLEGIPQDRNSKYRFSICRC